MGGLDGVVSLIAGPAYDRSNLSLLNETAAGGECSPGATTAPRAFTLDNPELRARAFDYRLFQGGINGSDSEDRFLRSSFRVGPVPPEMLHRPRRPSRPVAPLVGR
jgi:hypothetical protein